MCEWALNCYSYCHQFELSSGPMCGVFPLQCLCTDWRPLNGHNWMDTSRASKRNQISYIFLSILRCHVLPGIDSIFLLFGHWFDCFLQRRMYTILTLYWFIISHIRRLCMEYNGYYSQPFILWLHWRHITKLCIEFLCSLISGHQNERKIFGTNIVWYSTQLLVLCVWPSLLKIIFYLCNIYWNFLRILHRERWLNSSF